MSKLFGSTPQSKTHSLFTVSFSFLIRPNSKYESISFIFTLLTVRHSLAKHIDRIATPDYIPNDEDILRYFLIVFIYIYMLSYSLSVKLLVYLIYCRCRARTTGIVEIEFAIERYKFRLVSPSLSNLKEKRY